MAARAPDAGDDPERQPRTLAPAEDGRHRRRGREQGDHDGAVAGRRGGERERGEQREADDDAAGDHREPRPLRAAGKPLPGEREGEGGEDRGDHGAAGADEQRRQAGDGHLGERNREREGRYSEEAPPESGGLAGRYQLGE